MHELNGLQEVVLQLVQPDAIVGRALCIMRGWLKVVDAEMSAEFPSFEFVQAFSPFNLSNQVAATVHREPPGGATAPPSPCNGIRIG